MHQDISFVSFLLLFAPSCFGFSANILHVIHLMTICLYFKLIVLQQREKTIHTLTEFGWNIFPLVSETIRF